MLSTWQGSAISLVQCPPPSPLTGRPIEATASRPRSSPMPYGCISASTSASATFRICSPSVASSVSHETIRQWCTKFGATFAAGLRRRRVRAGDKWHLDEVALKIRGKRHWLWRAVDQHGLVLDILVQERRDQVAAERFLHRVLDSERRRRAARGHH